VLPAGHILFGGYSCVYHWLPVIIRFLLAVASTCRTLRSPPAGHPKPLKEGRKKKEKERETGGDRGRENPTPPHTGQPGVSPAGFFFIATHTFFFHVEISLSIIRNSTAAVCGHPFGSLLLASFPQSLVRRAGCCMARRPSGAPLVGRVQVLHAAGIVLWPARLLFSRWHLGAVAPALRGGLLCAVPVTAATPHPPGAGRFFFPLSPHQQQQQPTLPTRYAHALRLCLISGFRLAVFPISTTVVAYIDFYLATTLSGSAGPAAAGYCPHSFTIDTSLLPII